MHFAHVHAPAPLEGPRPYIFLAGNGGDWRQPFCESLEAASRLVPTATIFDPWSDMLIEPRTHWEFDALNLADIIVFWFAPETDAPLSLFELGCWLGAPNKYLVLGAHPAYSKREELHWQLKLRLRKQSPLADNLHAVQAALLTILHSYWNAGCLVRP